MGISRLGRLLSPLLVAALLSVLAPVAAAQEATTFNVNAGGFSDPESAVVVNDFLPGEVTVNVGDTVVWNIIGFHNVLFPAAGESPPALIIPDPDDESRMMINPVVAFPSGGNTYDGSALRNSGLPPEEGSEEPITFSLTFTAPGSYTYYCSVHPGMMGTVVVQAGGALPMTPEQVVAAGEEENAEQIAEVQAAEAAIQGTNRQPVLAGVVSQSGEAESLHFVPTELTVRVGETVTWTMEENSREIHTVTFLSGAPEIPFIVPEEQQGGPPKLVVNPQAAAPAGGSSYNGTGYVNSGIIAAGQSYSLTFTTPGTYEYYCIVHGSIMSGTVTVVAAAEAPAAPPAEAQPPAQAPAPQAPAPQVPSGLPATGDGSTPLPGSLPIDLSTLLPW